MNIVRLNAYAKVNLTLDITGVEGGYHTLDSLAVTVSLFDRIVVRRRKDNLVRVVMHGMGSESIPPEENNAVKAAEGFVSRFSTAGADITVYKNIPVGAGLGGSSADAAGAIRAMAKLYGISDMGALKSLADGFGSDTGYLLTGGFARMRGRGELVESLPTPMLHLLLICPQSGVSAGACYQEYDRLGKTYEPRTARVLELMGAPEWAARLYGNDLAEAAISLNPDVGAALFEARSFSPLGAGVTGSGSAAFAVFETRELCEWAKSRYRGKYRTYVVHSVDPERDKSKKMRNPFVLSEESD